MSTKVLTLFGEMDIPDVGVEPKRKPAPKKEKETVPKEKPAPKAKEKKAEAEETEEIVETPKAEKPVKEKEKRTLQKTEGLSNWQGDKQYYTIGEVASIFKVNTSNIRFWTKEFDMKVRTTRKGDRLYTPEQVREINTIYHLVKERGFTITGAKAKLKENRKSVTQTIDLKKSLLQLREKLLRIRKQLS